MSEGIYLDNDVVLKMCMYLFADELVKTTTLYDLPPAILGLARFTLRSRVDRSQFASDAVRAMLAHALSVLRRLEPTTEETELAAEFEQRANELGLEFDPGESQLVAILLKRGAPLLVTGDKRAIRALSEIAPEEANHRLACFEQLIGGVIQRYGHERLRGNVCAAHGVDRANTAIFSCSSSTITMENVMEGLLSYIGDLRKNAGRLLIASDDLSAVLPQEYSERIS